MHTVVLVSHNGKTMTVLNEQLDTIDITAISTTFSPHHALLMSFHISH